MPGSTRPRGDPAQTRRVEAEIRTEGGRSTLELYPWTRRSWTDPTTVYPVTIDPSFTKYASDAWVQYNNYLDSQGGSEELRVGTYDGGTHKARSYLQFALPAGFAGTVVSAAELKLWNWYSGSCTGSAIEARRVTSGAWTSGGFTWATQPTGTSTGMASLSAAHGYSSSCDADYSSWNVKDIAQAWANGSANYGIRLVAANEASNNTWRKYRSANYVDGGTGSHQPHLIVTYNSYPNTPPNKATAPPSPCVTGTGRPWLNTTLPTLKATMSDPDGGTVTGTFAVYTLTGTTPLWTGSIAVSSGATASKTVTAAAGLVNGNTYRWRAQASGRPSSPWAWYCEFSVDTVKPTVAVTASSFTDGQWTTDVPASNTFTFDGPSDTKSFAYTLDGVAQATKAADVNGNATLVFLPSNGSHTVTVTPTDKAGNVGAAASFSFGVGSASFTTPAMPARSTEVFPIHVSGPPNATGASLSWRYAGQGSGTWSERLESPLPQATPGRPQM